MLLINPSLCSRYYYCLHFAEEDTETQGGCVMPVPSQAEKPSGTHLHKDNKKMKLLLVKQRVQPIGTHHGEFPSILGPPFPSWFKRES